ncbi:MAG: hypothetical protein ABI895_29070 [Deltaproteobacteria bacterium]
MKEPKRPVQGQPPAPSPATTPPSAGTPASAVSQAALDNRSRQLNSQDPTYHRSRANKK